MGAYMYPITIKREPQIIRYQKEIELENGLLTLEILRKYIKEGETFSISESEEDNWKFKTMLYINCKRLETNTERDKRVSKEEVYMEKYNELHNKK